MPKDSRFPDLGLFFGDQGGPGTALPRTDAERLCPFLDAKAGEFCSLDGAMCPFVGFNYRKCKKYTNNISRGALSAGGIENSNPTKPGKPPRLESLLEAKKGGSKKRAKAEVNVSDADMLDILRGGDFGDDDDFEDIDLLMKGVDDKFGVDTVKTDTGVTRAKATAQKKKADNPKKNVKMSVKKGKVTKPKTAPKKKPVTPEVEAAREKVKPAQETRRSKLRRERAHNFTKLVLAHNTHNLGMGVSGGGYKERFNATQVLLNTRMEKVPRELRGHYRKTAREMANFNREAPTLDADGKVIRPGGVSSTDDEISARLYGTPHSQGEIGPKDSPTAQSNVNPDVKPHSQGETDAPPASPMPNFDDFMAAQDAKDAKDVKGKKKKAGTKPSLRDRMAAQGFHAPRAAPVPKVVVPPIERPGGMPQTSSKVRRPEQLESWFRSLTYSQHKKIFKGRGASGYTGAKMAIRHAHRVYGTNNTSDVAKMHTYFKDRLEAAEAFESKKAKFDADFEENVRKLKKMNLIDDDMLRTIGHDPGKLEQVAKTQNKILDRLFTVKTKKLNIGDSSVTQFLRETTVPVMTRSSFEATRMAEQMGMAAIRKQHQYGRRYGKFNTANLFLRDIVMPLVVGFLAPKDLMSGMITALHSRWPSALFDQFYFAFVEKPLPTMQGVQSGPAIAKDTAFLASQKMGKGSTSDKIMKGFYDDKAGIYLPPDRAVLHTRAYPTTKSTWGKTRGKALTARHQEVKARNSKADWKRGFLRR